MQSIVNLSLDGGSTMKPLQYQLAYMKPLQYQVALDIAVFSGICLRKVDSLRVLACGFIAASYLPHNEVTSYCALHI